MSNILTWIKAKGIMRLQQCAMKHTLKQPTFSSGYYVLLPEIPLLNGDKNPLFSSDCVPNFRSIEPMHILNAMMLVSSNFDVKFDECVKIAKESRRSIDFNRAFGSFMKEFNDLNRMDQYCRGIANILGRNHIVAYLMVFNTLSDSMALPFNNSLLYLASKEILADNDNNLNADERRFLEAFNNLSYHNGSSLSQKSKAIFNKYSSALSQWLQRYCLKLSYCTLNSNVDVTDEKALDGIPLYLKQILKNGRSLWQIPSEEPVFNIILTHCNNRELRREVTKKFYGRATRQWRTTHWDNGLEIKNILICRKSLAEILGYNNASEMAMKLTSTCVSIDHARDAIMRLRLPLKSELDGYLDEMKLYMQKRGLNHKLETCDLLYYGHKLFTEKHTVKDSIHDQLYLSLKNVVIQLFYVCEKLLNLNVEDVTQSFKHKMKTKFSCVFRIKHQGIAHPAYMIVEPDEGLFCLSRPESFVLRENEENRGAVLYLRTPTCNLGRDPWDYVLNVEQISEIAFKLGHLMQSCIIKPTAFSNLSGTKGLEEDLVLVLPYMLKFLVLKPETFRKIFVHQRDKTMMPTHHAERHYNAARFPNILKFHMDLFTSEFDIQVHSSDKNYIDVLKKLWPEYFSLSIPDDEFFPCQLPELFGYHNYYFYFNKMRAQVIAANVLAQELDNSDESRDIFTNNSQYLQSLVGHYWKNTAATEFIDRSSLETNDITGLIQLILGKDA